MDTDAQTAASTGREASPADPAEQEDHPRRSRATAALGGLLRRPARLLAVVVVLVLLLAVFVAQPFVIPSTSMENTLRTGDRVLVNKVSYRFGGTPRRGDVVVFDGTDSFVPAGAAENAVTRAVHGVGAVLGLGSDDTTFVKRVVGVGGDRVTCCDRGGRITVNGRPLRERYLYPGNVPSSVRFDVVVPEGKLWVMGDHRARSSDSRAHLGDPGGGMVPVDRVVGRADLIVWPPSRWTHLTRPQADDGLPAAAGRG
ncbi:signal peptidase I [Streptomyces sp. NPDC059740]|uniref:signal peptidase I n=1 Tax=Streptomyces sp. NPDC059740 TaxID=3346926 RepID=UPI00365AF29F